MALEVWRDERADDWFVVDKSDLRKIRGRFSSESDARKFAAADQMLEALKAVASDTKNSFLISLGADEKVRDAIAAAEPKPPTPPTTEELVGIISELLLVDSIKSLPKSRLGYAKLIARADAAINAAKGGVA